MHSLLFRTGLEADNNKLVGNEPSSVALTEISQASQGNDTCRVDRRHIH